MAEKYYWLKLQRDFFKRHDIQIVESMKNGKDYVLFYLKLLCESIDHEGRLRFSEAIPYNDDMLATITHTDIDVVRSAVKIFTELGLMELQDDGTFFMNEVQKMIGSAVDNANANRQRRFRERQKQLALSERYESVTENNESKSKSKSKSKNICDSDDSIIAHTHEEALTEVRTEGVASLNDQEKARAFMASFNAIEGVKTCMKMTCSREMSIAGLMSEFSEEDIQTVFRKIGESDWLTGRAVSNNRMFHVYFDWILDKSNFLKILEGVYDNNNLPLSRHKRKDYSDVKPEDLDTSDFSWEA